MITVTLYNDVSLIPSFWFAGFKILQEKGKIKLRYKWGNQAPISNESRKWKSTLFETSLNGVTRTALIDILDNYKSIDESILRNVDLYFKFNFNRSYIQSNFKGFEDKIRATGFYFPIIYNQPASWYYEYLHHYFIGFLAKRNITPMQRHSEGLFILRQFRTLTAKHSFLHHYTHTLRKEKEDLHDLFWNVNYWDAENYNSQVTNQQRVDMMKVLEEIKTNETDKKLVFGFFDNSLANREYPQYVLKPTPPTREYLGIVARSKMSIVSRGLWNCFSWRLGEHMAMGKFVLVERPINEPYVALTEGKNVVFFENNLSDFAEKITYYLQHDHERKEIAQQSASYFDRYCTPDVQITHMLNALYPGHLANP